MTNQMKTLVKVKDFQQSFQESGNNVFVNAWSFKGIIIKEIKSICNLVNKNNFDLFFLII